MLASIARPDPQNPELTLISLGADFRYKGRSRDLRIRGDINNLDVVGVIDALSQKILRLTDWGEGDHANLISRTLDKIGFLQARGRFKQEINDLGFEVKKLQEEVKKLREEKEFLHEEVNYLRSQVPNQMYLELLSPPLDTDTVPDTLLDLPDEEGETLNMMVQLGGSEAHKDEVQDPKKQDSVRLGTSDFEAQSWKSSDVPELAEPEPVMAKKKRKVPEVAAPTGTSSARSEAVPRQ